MRNKESIENVKFSRLSLFYLFTKSCIDIIRIFAEPFSDNAGPRRVLEKLEFLSDMGKKGAKTKEAIRREAYRLFAEKGFKAVTMTDICEKTGLSRGGLYRYYSGTEQIFSEILSEEYVIADRIEKKEKASAILEDINHKFSNIVYKMMRFYFMCKKSSFL